MANKSQTFARAPKRRIERVKNVISHTITTSTTASTLHTVEDRKTLVRAIIQLEVVPNAAALINLRMDRLPGGNSVGSPSVGQSLDNDAFKEELWTWQGGNGASVTESQIINVDLKSMRKLDPGDLITLKDIGNAADSGDLVGVITLFFKE